MDQDLLKKYADRVLELLERASASNLDANFYRTNEFLQNALMDASRRGIYEPRNDDGVTRWSMEFSNREDMELLDAVASFLILLRGWELPS
jgi:hypothetical protein